MGDELADIEKALLAAPFDVELRLRYAGRLRDAGRLDDAVAQYELVRKSGAPNAAAETGLAACELANGDERAAIDRYMKARNLDGFVPDPELEALLRKAQAKSPSLSVVRDAESAVTPIRAEAKTTRFDDVAGMDALKKILRLQIIEPFRNPGLFSRFSRKAGGGVLLYGPPGCGKTLMARAIAGECKAEFQAVGISDVLNMWIGESERNLAAIFDEARSRRPCVLFFDELDALAYSRSKTSSSAARTVVNEFLAQLDGFGDNNEGILILAATNMPWDVDPAMKRPGRFSRQVFVPPPDAEAREAMLRLKTAALPMGDVDFAALAARTEYFSGADIDGLIELATEVVLSEVLDGSAERSLDNRDFAEALDNMTPSTTEWLKTARNLVKFSSSDSSYKDVAKYLKKVKRL